MTDALTVIDIHAHATLDIDGVEAGINLPYGIVPPWSVQRTLDIQDENGISSSILSMPDAGTHFDDATNVARARLINEFLVGIRDDHPTRFGTMAALPMTTIDGALEEVTYALDILKMDAVSLPTSVGDVYLGDSIFDPLFEELDRRGATVFTHPVRAEASRPVSLGINQSMLEFVFDTTRMITNLIFSGATARFPDIKIIASHGGGTFPYLVSRLMTLEPITGPGPGRTKLSAEEIKEAAGHFHYDVTAATSRAHLTALLEIVPPSHLLAGFDIPFMPPSTIAPALSAIRAWNEFDENDVEQVLHGNAAVLFPQVATRLETGSGTESHV